MNIRLGKCPIPEFDQIVCEKLIATNQRMYYRKGKLYLHNGKRFAVLSAGNNPCCWTRRFSDDEWCRSGYLADRLFLRYDFLSKEPAAASHVKKCRSGWVEVSGQKVLLYTREELLAHSYYFRQIPEKIAVRIEWLESRRWNMYVFMAQVEEGIELYDSNPALAFMLANSQVFGSDKIINEHQSLRSLCKRRQIEILKLLGFPEEEPVRKILRKVKVGALTIGDLLKLRKAMKDREIRKWLTHLPCITNEIIILTGDPLWRNMLTSVFLLELANDDMPNDFRGVLFWIQDSACWSSKYPLALGKIYSAQQLMNRWDEVETYYQLSSVGEFPAPPLSGTQEIFPIRTAAELHEEVKKQESCVLRYLKDIQNGTYYLYKTDKPERITIGLIHAGGIWRANQIRGRRNKEISYSVKLRLSADLGCVFDPAKVLSTDNLEIPF